ncbi:aminotransferase class I/II-fold pyridoxal phosphate-dependent enzyme [Luteococcus sp. H138]|uniref:aminotransferase class I/II-fold pyridoxal phosphate-dependent enzyme n=1 Tax=unclassified Luteococcus TaxID=2639923 RepID=UPI00313DFA79
MDPDAVDLASNDYLGLSHHPKVRSCAARHLQGGPLGAGASRVVTGSHPAHAELEGELCALTGASAALVFSSGYTANLGALGALAGPRSRLLLDEQAHASLHDGARLAHAEALTFRHNDLTELSHLLQDDGGRRTTVVVESVYSVLGDAAPLVEVAALCRKFGAALVVDEAHTIGTLSEGSWARRDGLFDHDAEAPPVVVTATLSKALGAQGGVILLGGDHADLWRAHMVNLARAFIFDTALAPAVAAGAAEACRLARTTNLPECLASNRALIVDQLRGRPGTARHLEMGAGSVISLRMPSSASALAASQELRDRGILVGCFRPPSVPDRIARLRLTAHADTNPERLVLALTQIADVVEAAWGEPTRCPFNHADGRPSDHRELALVSDPDDVREVLGNPDLFAADNALRALRPFTREAARVLVRSGFKLPPVLASANGAQHRDVRRVVTPFFSPARVKAQRELVQRLVREQLTELGTGLEGGVDLASTVAAHAPARIAAELTGVPNPPHEDLARWSADSLELFWGWPDDDRQLQLAHSAAEFHPWLRQTVRDSAGTRNLFGRLAAEGVDEERIISLGYFLVIAGQETTRMLIATCLHHAASDRERWTACGDEDRGEQATASLVHEVLSEMSSVPTWRRIATRDGELAGRPITAGEEVLVQLSGGHAAPDQADPSLAFGYGIHRCLGAALAEMEAAVILHETTRALPDAQLVSGGTVWLRLLSFQCPRSVVVTSHHMKAFIPAPPRHPDPRDHPLGNPVG